MKRPTRTRLAPTRIDSFRAVAIGINYLGCIALILAVTGACSFFIIPDRAKDVWAVIGPLLGATIGSIAGVWSQRRWHQI